MCTYSVVLWFCRDVSKGGEIDPCILHLRVVRIYEIGESKDPSSSMLALLPFPADSIMWSQHPTQKRWLGLASNSHLARILFAPLLTSLPSLHLYESRSHSHNKMFFRKKNQFRSSYCVQKIVLPESRNLEPALKGKSTLARSACA